MKPPYAWSFCQEQYKHLGLDLVMPGAGLAPCGVEGLVEILHKVGGLA
jgi:hypothetical protein